MRIPKHIAIIPDGNRRWAQHSGFEKQAGYKHGLMPGVEVLRLAEKYGIEELTYYGFTTDNCKRPAVQVKAFTKACVDAIKLIQSENARLLVVGNTHSSMFPPELLPLTKTRTTFNAGTVKVNFLVNYGWEWDLGHLDPTASSRTDIMHAIASHDISRIDLVIRWGGRRRLSGLLPVQAVYADFFVIDEMWPDFCEEQFVRALSWYNEQDITLGG